MGKSKAVKPTLVQKKYISAAGLVVKNWLVLGETDTSLQIVSRASGQCRNIKKLPPQAGYPKRQSTKNTAIV